MSEDFSKELHDEPGESQPTETTDGAEARVDFWSIQGDFIYRHDNEPRVQLHVPKEETFTIPLKYFAVTCLLTLISMCYKRNVAVTFGTSV